MLTIEKITGAIGAEISGVSLNNDLTTEVCNEIYDALIDNQVIFFRNQNITPEVHIQLAESFGEPEPPHPVYPHVEGYENIVLLKSGGGDVPDTNDWHKDMTFKTNPPFTSILHAVNIPKVGGDTLWSSTSAAYDNLSDGWKDQLEGLEAMHDIGTFRNDFYKKGGIEAVNNALKDTGSAVHRIIDTHPVSGLKYLNVNQSFTRHIVGMIQGESDRILHYLYQHMAKPEFQVRFRWRNNSIAIWDNRITHHYAICDYLPNIRHMQRVTVLNDKRVS
ncbi:MAG TPA: taurine dioxygenase [Candidatus Thioglobus sp.]|jgi:taurine dioxygenase|nr:taurine dioxygenase [Candidatus Thioglobus sp.]HIL21631.1 taurine dioxygenase [Candidatus Thioglobus sp.]